MNLPDYSSGYWPLLLTFIFFAIITGRYFVVAGLFYLIFYIWYPEKWKQRKLNQKKYTSGQLRNEMKWSILSSLIFSIAGSAMVILWQNGYTRIYQEINQFGGWYLPVSLVIFLLAHETFYYWLHRWMHLPGIFRIVHKIHHNSHIASPFTAFSFHPLEALLQAVFMPVMIMILPMHYFVIILILLIMTFTSVINHLDIELYSGKSFRFLGKWIIGATHHSLHHRQFKYNYGLYFTFWDKIKKTESPMFKSLYNKITSLRK